MKQKIKTFLDYPSIVGYDQYSSAVLGFNKIDKDKISELLPDLDKSYSVDDYLSLMSSIDKGNDFVKLIKENKNKKFCVVGDYDCDGIMATTIMCYGLTLCGIDCTYTISDRFTTGYGMHKEQIDIAKNNKAEIIVTVDNGITANSTIDYAHSLGMKVFVTDHHEPQEKNNADICIDPFYNNDKFKEISGATVALKLMYLLQKEFNFSIDILRDFVCCAGLTVMSDVMPMLGENRILVKSVFKKMNSDITQKGSFTNRLAKLVEYYVPGKASDPYLNLAGTFRAFNKDNIDFYLVPIINAMNRVVGDVTELVYDIMMLFVQDYDGVPHYYSGINKKRKFMRTELDRLHKEDPNTKAVVEMLNPGKYEDNYSGIVGLVASDIVEKENKPALIGVDLDENVIHFSGRSVSGFNLFESLGEIKKEHPELHLNFGGHAEALGASCNREEIPLVQSYLSEKFAKAKISESCETYFEFSNYDYIVDAFYNLWPFGNKFMFPKFLVESSVLYLNKANRTFTLKTLGNHAIKFYDKATMEKLEPLAFKQRDKKIKCILSFSEDENDDLQLKLDRIL